ncbi:hypothetical protein AB0H57_30395 [Micromonospora sp. NPDC050686]|uniref:hypothetical protein n=1 Tax=Micromonospora sp. NPDC050686 TaxID=3154631 RepID=UPI0033CDC827
MGRKPHGQVLPAIRPWLDLVISDTYDRFGGTNLHDRVISIVRSHATGAQVTIAITESLAAR